jgi:putative Holliday junction resolvase
MNDFSEKGEERGAKREERGTMTNELSGSAVGGSMSGGHKDFPAMGRLLGLDFGTKRVGLAVSNEEQTIASPLANYTRRGKPQDARYLNVVVEQYSIKGVIVGLPVHMSGAEGGKAREARDFGAWVSETTGRPVRFWDERFTSLQADEYLLAAELTKKQRKARRDKLAAQVMLKSYLDATDKEQSPPPLR